MTFQLFLASCLSLGLCAVLLFLGGLKLSLALKRAGLAKKISFAWNFSVLFFRLHCPKSFPLGLAVIAALAWQSFQGESKAQQQKDLGRVARLEAHYQDLLRADLLLEPACFGRRCLGDGLESLLDEAPLNELPPKELPEANSCLATLQKTYPQLGEADLKALKPTLLACPVGQPMRFTLTPLSAKILGGLVYKEIPASTLQSGENWPALFSDLKTLGWLSPLVSEKAKPWLPAFEIEQKVTHAQNFSEGLVYYAQPDDRGELRFHLSELDYKLRGEDLSAKLRAFIRNQKSSEMQIRSGLWQADTQSSSALFSLRIDGEQNTIKIADNG